MDQYASCVRTGHGGRPIKPPTHQDLLLPQKVEDLRRRVSEMAAIVGKPSCSGSSVVARDGTPRRRLSRLWGARIHRYFPHAAVALCGSEKHRILALKAICLTRVAPRAGSADQNLSYRLCDVDEFQFTENKQSERRRRTKQRHGNIGSKMIGRAFL
jgi:hypothetical protein